MITMAQILSYSDKINTDHHCTFNQQCGFAANKLAYDSEIELLPIVKGAAEVYSKNYISIDAENISSGQNEFSYYAPPHPLTAKRRYFERYDIIEAYYLLGKHFPLN